MVEPLSGGMESVIERIYDSVADPCALAEVLEYAASRLDSHSALLFTPHIAPEFGGLNILYNQDPKTIELYRDHFHTVDLWWHSARTRVRNGETGVITGDELVSRREFEHSEFYNDFLRRQDTYNVIAADMQVSDAGAGIVVSLAFHGRLGHKGFGTQHRSFVEALLPHLRRAIRLSMKVGKALDGLRCAVSALEELADGVLLLGANGRVLHATRSAEAVLASAGALRLVDGRLSAWAAKDNRCLADLFRRVALRVGGCCAGTIALTSPTSSHPLVVTVFQLPCRDTPLAAIEGARMLALIRDPARKAVTKWQVFASHFALTPAELKLCQALSGDTTLSEYCAEQAITENTARSQLKSVFRKTAIHRQSELLSLIQAFS